MKKNLFFGVMLLLSMGLTARAQDRLDEILATRTTVHVSHRPLGDALRSIGASAGFKVEFEKDLVAGKIISFHKSQITLQDAIEQMLRPHGLTFIPMANNTIRLVRSGIGSIIRGRIVDSESGEPVAFANVFLKDTAMGSATDENGKFEIEDIPLGSFQFEIRHMGYESYSVELNLQSGKIIDREFKMKPDVLQLETVTAIAEKERVVYQPQISAYSLRARQFDMMPSQGDKDVFRALQMMPGVVVTNDFKSQLYIRGGNSDQNLVLLDGGIVYNPFHFSGIMSAFDVDALDKVEFYAGGFGAEYGSRLSSVLSIHTKTGNNKKAGLLNLSPLSVKLLAEGPIKQWGNILLSARRSYVTTFAEKMGNSVVPDFYDGIARIDIRPTRKDTITLSAFYGNDNVRLKQARDEENMSSENLSTALNYYRTIGALRLLYTGSYGYFTNQTPPPISENEQNVNSMKEFSQHLQVTFPLTSAASVKMGGQWHQQRISYKSADPILAEMWIDKPLQELALYIDNRITLGTFEVQSGLRFNRYDKSQPWITEPRLALHYKPYNFLSVKAAYGRYSQNLVTIFNENDTYNPVDIWLPPEEYMDLAQADHFIAGVIWRTPALVLSMEAYYKQVHHLTQYNRERLFPADPYFVQGKGYAYGIDLSGQWLHDTWQVWASYSLGKAIKELPFTYPQPGIDRFAPRYDRRHNLNVAFEYRPNAQFELSARFTLGSGTPFGFMIGAYQRWSLFVINVPSAWYDNHPDERLYYITAIQSERDAFRFPTYHRLDISIKVRTHFMGMRVYPYAQILNLYDQPNILYYDANAKPHTSVPFLPMLGIEIPMGARE
ncbi:TonB-dependent receptor plug domain-containing protein [candidate division KSB1 bacterium]|nr:TonB-dependent receptor plug domain-containing protein [candidate division KSB1 bacterium]